MKTDVPVGGTSVLFVVVGRSGGLEEDALARALLGRFDGQFFLTSRHVRQSLLASWVSLVVPVVGAGAILGVGKAVVEDGEDVWRYLLAEAISGA